MRRRIDIFPTSDGEVHYGDLNGMEIACLVGEYGTTDADVDLSHDGEVRYIHVKRIKHVPDMGWLRDSLPGVR